ncbi:metalloendopeptidase [Elysia marginata]|uniref:Metalloendopeptidase n=1 Tax=Elysia marginata TaxID=1093978 RepID=A0AAV4GC19_9GAST|nr:metalloendopeptidase [Elysia marginata]
MHYSAYIFAVDGSKPTITPKPNLAQGKSLGQRLKLSTNDVKRVQLLYGCTVDTNHIIEPANTQLLIDCTFESGWCGLVQVQ